MKGACSPAASSLTKSNSSVAQERLLPVSCWPPRTPSWGGGSSQHRDPAVLTSCGLLSPVNFEPSRQGEAETGSDSSQIGNLPSLM